jgi:hypothetical protein
VDSKNPTIDILYERAFKLPDISDQNKAILYSNYAYFKHTNNDHVSAMRYWEYVETLDPLRFDTISNIAINLCSQGHMDRSKDKYNDILRTIQTAYSDYRGGTLCGNCSAQDKKLIGSFVFQKLISTIPMIYNSSSHALSIYNQFIANIRQLDPDTVSNSRTDDPNNHNHNHNTPTPTLSQSDDILSLLKSVTLKDPLASIGCGSLGLDRFY